MRHATLIIHNSKAEVIAEIEVDETPDDATEAGMKRHYDRIIKLFMRHLGPSAHVHRVIWDNLKINCDLSKEVKMQMEMKAMRGYDY